MYKPFVSRFKKITNSLKNRHHILKGNFSIWLVFLAIIVVSFFAFQNQAQAITGDYNKDIGNNSLAATEWNNLLSDFVNASGDTMSGILNIFMPSGGNPELRIQSVSGVDNHWAIYNDRTTKDLRFWNNDISGEKNLLNLTNEGRVGINTTDPQYLVDISGDARVTGTLYAGSFSGPLTGTLSAVNVSAGQFGVNTGGGVYSFPGGVAIGTTSPLARLHINQESGQTMPASGIAYSTTGLIVSGIDGAMALASRDDNTAVSHYLSFPRYKNSDGTLISKFGIVVTADTGSQNSNLLNEFSIRYGTNTYDYINTQLFTIQRDGDVIANIGNVGIGITAPVSKLDVNVSGMDVGIGLRAGAGVMGGLNIYSGTSPNRRLTAHSYDGFAFYTGAPGFTGGTERIRINSVGNLGIGTVTPTAPLHVQGAGYFSGTVSVATPTSGPHATTKDYVDSAVSGATDADWIISGNNQYSGVSDNVGIGTTGPQKKLDVRGAAYIEGEFAGSAGSFDNLVLGQGSYSSDSNRELRFQSNTDLGSYHQYMIYNGKAVGEPETFIQGRYQRFSAIGFLGGDTNFLVNTGAGGAGSETVITPTTALTIEYTGNIGINDSTPSYKLDVNGTSRFTQPVIVATPILGPHATTKDYVDSAIGGGSGSTVGYWTMNGTSIYNSNAGNVGIGTASPTSNLQIEGDVLIKSGEYLSWGTEGVTAIEGSTVSNKLDFKTNSTSRLFIADGGNVGIGTTSPTSKLHLSGAGETILNLATSDVYSTPPTVAINAVLKYNAAGSITNMGKIVFAKNNALDGDTGAYTAFYKKPPSQTYSEAMRIDPSGNLGINTNNPTYKLDVNGTARFTNTVVVATPTSGPHAATKDYVDSAITGGDLDWTISGSDQYSSVSGNVGVGTTSPSQKLHIKGNILVEDDDSTDTVALIANSGDDGWLTLYQNTAATVHLHANSDSYINGGNVGIGTAGPTSALQVRGTAGQPTSSGSSGNGTIRIDATSNVGMDIGSYDVAPWGIWMQTVDVNNAANHYALTLNPLGGNVGIGTTSPTAKLHVNGTGYFSNVVTVATPTADPHAATKAYVDSAIIGGDLDWTISGNNQYSAVSGNVGIGTSNPTAKVHVRNIDTHTTGAYTGQGHLLLYNHQDNADELGAFLAFGSNYSDGSQQFTTRAGIKGGTDTAGNSADGYLAFYTANGSASNNLERMRINKDGNVGIGTTNPSTKLEVVGSINIKPTNAGQTSTGYVRSYQRGGSTSNSDLRLGTTDDGEMIVINNGVVGIGTADPAYKLDVQGTGGFTNTVVVATPTAGSHATTKDYVDSAMTSGDNDWAGVGGDPTLTGEIYHTGNAGIGTNDPAYRLDVIGTINAGDNSGGNTPTILRSRISATQGSQILLGSNYSPAVGVRYSSAHPFLSSNASQTTVSVDNWAKGSTTYSSNILTLGISTGNNSTAFEVRHSPASTASGAYFSFFTSPLFTVGENGNVGVGSSSPGYKLDVNGTGRFTNVVTVATPTADPHAATKAYVDSAMTGGISGTTNYISKFTGTNSLGNSQVFDNGTHVGIGTTSPTEDLDVEGRMSLSNNVITESIIWPNLYDTGADRKVRNVILNTDDMLAYAVDRGWTVTASRGPDSGSLTDMFRPTGSAMWNNVSSGNPVVITINMPSSALDRMIIVPAYRNQLPLDYKVETYDIYTPGNWATRKDVTGETAPYIKFIDLATQEGVQQIKITVTDAGDGSFDQSLSISNIVATSRYQAGRFTGYAMSAEGDTMYGNLAVTGTGNFSNVVTVATPTADPHAATKAYVDSAIIGGDLDWTISGNNQYSAVSGNVGIGTTNPGSKLHLYNSTTRNVLIEPGDAIDVSGTAQIKLKEYVPGIEFDDQSSGYSDALLFLNQGKMYVAKKTGTALSTSSLFNIDVDTGSVGIGTTSPFIGRLDIYHSTDSTIMVRSSSGDSKVTLSENNVGLGYGGYIKYDGVSNLLQIGTQVTAEAPVITIPRGGSYAENVGIGTISPTAKLYVNGTGYFSNVVTVATPTASTHATTKSYVDGLIGGGVGAGTSGQTLRHDGTSWIANNVLYNNGTNIGIGTTSPGKKLQVHSATISDIVRFENDSGGFVLGQTSNLTSVDLAISNAFRIRQGSSIPLYIKSDGNVGIGTTSPLANLNVMRTTSGTTGMLSLRPSTSGNDLYQDLDFEHWSYSASPHTLAKIRNIMIPGWGGQLSFWTMNNADDILYERLTILPDGNVGINTNTPLYKLDVNGTSRFVQPVIVATPTAGSHATTKDYVDSAITGGDLDWTISGNNQYSSVSGNVGIGTTNPTEKFHIVGDTIVTGNITGGSTSSGTISQSSSYPYPTNISLGANAGYIQITAGSSTFSRIGIFGPDNGGGIQFITGGNEKMRVASSGNIGIGTTNPLAKLAVEGTLSSGAEAAILLNNVGSAAHSYRLQAGVSGVDHDDFAIFDTGTPNAVRLLIDENGNVGINQNNPSYKLYVGGTGYFDNTVVVATPTASTHATTKSYVDGLIGGGVGAGTSGQTLRHDGSSWVANSFLYNNGTKIGIGTTNPSAQLDVVGTIAASSVRQSRPEAEIAQGCTVAISGGSLVSGGPTYRNIDSSWTITAVGQSITLDCGGWWHTGISFAGGGKYETSGTKLPDGFTIERSDNGGSSWLPVSVVTGNTASSYNVNLTDAPMIKITVDSFQSGETQASISALQVYMMYHRSVAQPFGYTGTGDVVQMGSNVGIGTTTTSTKLDILGNVKISKNTDPTLYITAINSGSDPAVTANIKITGYEGRAKGMFLTDADTTNEWFVGETYSTAGLSLGYDTTAGGQSEYPVNTALFINTSRNVSIGTTSPSAKFHVAGAGYFSNVVTVATPTSSTHATTKSYVDGLIGGGVGTGTSGQTLRHDGTSWIANSLLYNNGTNVGIGTASPGRKLEVTSTTGGTLRLKRDDVTVVAEDNIGTIEFYSNDADTPKISSYIRSVARELYGREAALTFGVSQTINTDATEAMRINENGNVGIGTTSPGEMLEVYDGNIKISNNTNPATLILRGDRGNIDDDGRVDSRISFRQDVNNYGYDISAENYAGLTALNFEEVLDNVSISRLYISNTGNVGIGTTTTSAKLHVAGTGYFSNVVTVATPTASTHATTKSYVDGLLTAGDNDWAGVGGNPTLTGEIYHTGNIGIGTNNPITKLQVGSDWAAGGSGTIYLGSSGFANSNLLPEQIITTASTDIIPGRNIGLALHNNTSTAGSYAPLLVFSTMETGASVYNGATSAIGSRTVTGSGAGGAYIDGEMMFYTAPTAGSGLLERMRIAESGNVGIGSTSPAYKLDVNGTVRATAFVGGLTGTVNAANVSAGEFGSNTGGGNYRFPANVSIGTAASAYALDIYGNMLRVRDNADAQLLLVGTDSWAGIGFDDSDASGANYLWYNGSTQTFSLGGGGGSGTNKKLHVDGAVSIGANYDSSSIPANGLRVEGVSWLNGAVAIGTTSPGTNMLKVAGNMEVTGTLTTQTGADFAEEFEVVKILEPGTVVIVGDLGYKSVKASDKDYDSRVVGVVSGNPSMIAGIIKAERKVVVAMVGVVKVKITDKNGIIKKGDLLTTSSIEGYAMKATSPQTGTIIGKALEDASNGNTEIMALINLQ